MRKINLTILSFIFFPLLVLGQSIDKKKTVGFTFSPNYCNMINNSEYNTIITPRFGFTTGVSLWFKKSEKLYIESGLLFSNFGIRFIDNNPTYITNSEERIYNYYSVNIPVKVKYMLTTGKAKFYLSGGGALNWLLATRYRIKLEYNGGYIHSEDDTDFDVVIIPLPNLIVGIGAKFDLNEKVFVKIEPTLRCTPNMEGILSSNPTSFAINNPYYSAGVDFGIYYTIK
ncbi:MAG: outer membrane beta-barrel protein [Bacteroidota bacterium]